MRLLTFQDKFVLDRIEVLERDNKKPIYVCNENRIRNEYENLYNKYIARMKSSLGIDSSRRVIPIWCWVIPKKLELTKEVLNDLINRETIKCNRLVALELEVPNEFCFISNFTVWNDLKFKCIFENNDIKDEELDELFIKQKGAILQVTLPFISKDFIKKVLMDENNYIERDYSKTDTEIKELHAKGEFLEG